MPILAKTGNEAMAEAMRQINPDVVAAYPITPATEIVMIFSGFVADGLVDTEFVAVESEHSAMSACVGAAAAGARVMTGTSSQGLQLMSEILPIASALRLPIVLCEVNRALSAPINIHCDHSDTMAVRDFGWMQVYAENAQEAYDSIIQMIRISEDERVRLPGMVSTDGFIISHCMEKIEALEDNEVKKYIGEYKVINSVLDQKNPISIGSLDLQDYYFEHKMPVVEAMGKAKDVILEVSKDFGKRYGREYGLTEGYKLKDAEIALVAMGSTCGTTRAVVDELRERGVKAGLLKVRVFRPFPAEEIVQALSKVKAAAITDRSDGFSNQGGQLFTEIRSAMYEQKAKPILSNYIYGLGGREISLEDIRKIFDEQKEVADSGKVKQLIRHFGVRE
ncbi:pyruvate ferredoxin oxidoreductase [candidate division WOR-1 bacterium DG_54_3]|uniref:Pyruvate ferredoxin oxidoreductase n=1 Tax=candidate division WOR-1 bacterium DG_54_3 TaxID=1703775 RepID=A0A0S7Y0Z1_UNCSA|nr:MAG: pyruvate ferredoxin oxidoreductase [candidate division WOR-1 bacterium DG_54_3]